MAQHVSRKELKTDEVRDTFMDGIRAIVSHQQATLYIVIVALVVFLGVFGWRAYAARETVKASAGYDSAMAVFQAAGKRPRRYRSARRAFLQGRKNQVHGRRSEI